MTENPRRVNIIPCARDDVITDHDRKAGFFLFFVEKILLRQDPAFCLCQALLAGLRIERTPG